MMTYWIVSDWIRQGLGSKWVTWSSTTGLWGTTSTTSTIMIRRVTANPEHCFGCEASQLTTAYLTLPFVTFLSISINEILSYHALIFESIFSFTSSYLSSRHTAWHGSASSGLFICNFVWISKRLTRHFCPSFNFIWVESLLKRIRPFCISITLLSPFSGWKSFRSEFVHGTQNLSSEYVRGTKGPRGPKSQVKIYPF